MADYMSRVENELKKDMRLMTTSKGHTGMASSQAKVGDLLCVLEGMEFPIILRPCHADDIEAEDITCQACLHASAANPGKPSDRGYKVVGNAQVCWEVGRFRYDHVYEKFNNYHLQYDGGNSYPQQTVTIH